MIPRTTSSAILQGQVAPTHVGGKGLSSDLEALAYFLWTGPDIKKKNLQNMLHIENIFKKNTH